MRNRLATILITTFWKQNSYHRHGVLVHTVRVTWEILKAGEFKMLAAGLLHDIGKPFSAYQKPEDVENGEYSFTDHEELSYQIIKSWPFLSQYTKDLVRHHYLIRRIKKAKEKGLSEFVPLSDLYRSFPKEMRRDLGRFLYFDDLGKGKPER